MQRVRNLVRLGRAIAAGALVLIALAVALFIAAPEPVQTPTAAGLSGADLIGILAIVVTLFGLLLTAIGVLVLRQFSGLSERITEVKTDLSDDISQMRAAAVTDIGHVWRALDNVYRRLWNERVPTQGDYRDQPKDD